MSELEVYIAPTPDGTGLTDYYLKSEADKVITELEESHKMEVEQLLMEINELKAQKAQAEDDCAYWKTMSQKNASDNEVMAKQRAEAFKQQNEALNRERHHKYKRCLAMAWWCIAEAKVSDDEYRMYWWVNWHKRWLKLAEKFKEAK